MKWDKFKLTHITTSLASGGRPKGGAVQSGIPSIGAEHLDGKGGFNFTNVKYVPVDFFESLRNGKIEAEDILIVKDGATTGKTSFVNGNFPYSRAAINEHVFQLRVDQRLCLAKYCFYYLNSERGRQELMSDFRGATVGGISRSILDCINVPLPPLPIQKQIADTLDKADALRQKDQQLLEKYDELAQAIFYDMFGDPIKNNKGWLSGKVIEFSDCVVPGRDKPKSFSGDIPWVTTNDLIHLGITYESKKLVGLSDEEIKQVRARVIRKNSVIMTCVGDLGTVSIAGNSMVVNQQLHTFQCGEKMNPIFLMYSLSYQKEYMLKMASSTTLPYMNKTICNSIPVICPPIKTQNRFASIYRELYLQKESVIKGKKLGETLFESLIKDSFM